MVPSTIEEPKRLSHAHIDGESGRTVASRTRMRETAVIVSLGKGRGVSPLWPEPQTHNAHLSKNDYQGSHSIDTYDSPILQISSSPYVSGSRLDAGSTSLLVRLEGTTHLVNLIPNPEFIATSSSAPISVKRVAELGQNSTDRRRHVDVAMDPYSWGRAAIVDEGGGVWLWWEEKELFNGRLAKVTKLVKLRSSVSDAKDDFFRVAFGVRPDTLLVLSRHSIVEIDTSPAPISNRRIITLFSLQDPSETFTAIGRSSSLRGGGIIYVCTTKHVLWIDPSGTQSPLMRWRHELGGEQDQDLRLVVVSSEDAPAVGGETVLVYQPSSGRVHGTLTLTFDNGLPALISDPWVLSVPQSGEINTLVGFTLSPSKYRKTDGAVMLVSTGNDTFSVSKLSMSQDKRFDDESSQSSYPHIDIPSLANGLPATEPAAGTTSSKHLAIPGRWAWLSINDETATPLLDPAELSVYLKDPKDHLDTVATRAELVRAAAYLNPPTTRSHVLRGVNYQESFSASDIASATLSSHVEFSATNGTLLGDGVGELAASTPKRHKEAERERAMRRLRNDLQLSSKLVYPTDPRRPQAVRARGPTVDELFAEAAGKLSLDERVPSLSFAVLPPPPHIASHGEGWTPVSSSQDTRTAHALLQDWELGTDPWQHEWKPSRRSTSPITSPLRRDRTGPSVRRVPSQSTVPQVAGRPVSPHPRLHPQSSPVRRYTSAQVPTQRRGSPTFGRTPSSPTALSDPDTFPQTQIERGAHGARPEAATKASKKKVTKRRHGF
ncbi:hypothetical protein CcaverHIS631_0603740 [Cutaneotrichosporon cavernicola]|nr:hypothetical protein CcaverHIS631_0603740 [Cutaneotrichosporon cavernicola]